MSIAPPHEMFPNTMSLHGTLHYLIRRDNMGTNPRLNLAGKCKP